LGQGQAERALARGSLRLAGGNGRTSRLFWTFAPSFPRRGDVCRGRRPASSRRFATRTTELSGPPGHGCSPFATCHSLLATRSPFRGVAQTTCSSGRRKPQEAEWDASDRAPRSCVTAGAEAGTHLHLACRFAEGIRPPCVRARDCRVVQLCNPTPASAAPGRGTCLGSGSCNLIRDARPRAFLPCGILWRIDILRPALVQLGRTDWRP